MLTALLNKSPPTYFVLASLCCFSCNFALFLLPQLKTKLPHVNQIAGSTLPQGIDVQRMETEGRKKG
jgi:hypothetical protein